MDSLERFVSAQARDYGTALAEIRSGHKRSHWMWYIFPQLQGLGMSSTAQYYGIRGIEEAKRFIAHPVLGRNLREIYRTRCLRLTPTTRRLLWAGRTTSSCAHA